MSVRSRCIMGAAFGGLIALSYSLVAEYINVLVLPGVPIYHPPPGRAETVWLALLLGGVLGLIAAWPEDPAAGIVFSSLAGIVLSTLFGVIVSEGGASQAASAFLVLIFTILPRAILFAPLAGAVRWLLSLWEGELRQIDFSVRKLLLSVLAAALLASMAGMISLYPGEGRQAMRDMHALIQSGLRAARSEDLPAELRELDHFYRLAQGAYALELSNDPDRLPITRPEAPYGQEEFAVMVYFENGYRFGCVFPAETFRPICREF